LGGVIDVESRYKRHVADPSLQTRGSWSSVSNLNGRTIIRKNVSSPEFIPTQELPEGVYLIDLTGDTFTVKRKMIKNSILFSYNL